jgi:hypothetical protein
MRSRSLHRRLFATRHQAGAATTTRAAQERALEAGSESVGPLYRATWGARRVGLPDASVCPRGELATYVLTYDDPEAPTGDHPAGWTLHAWHADVACWSAALSAHGAGVLAGPRQAKAVVVRTLSDRGIAVEGWETGSDPLRPTYRATVAARLATPSG